MNISDFINVDAARAALGETKYMYVRIRLVFRSGRRRGQERHIEAPPVECTKEEYDANHKQGEHLNAERFFQGAANFRRDFDRYQRLVLQLQQQQSHALEIYRSPLATPEYGELRMCLVCATEKPWGVWDSKTGAAVCRECRDKARG